LADDILREEQLPSSLRNSLEERWLSSIFPPYPNSIGWNDGIFSELSNRWRSPKR